MPKAKLMPTPQIPLFALDPVTAQIEFCGNQCKDMLAETAQLLIESKRQRHSMYEHGSHAQIVMYTPDLSVYERLVKNCRQAQVFFLSGLVWYKAWWLGCSFGAMSPEEWSNASIQIRMEQPNVSMAEVDNVLSLPRTLKESLQRAGMIRDLLEMHRFYRQQFAVRMDYNEFVFLGVPFDKEAAMEIIGYERYVETIYELRKSGGNVGRWC